MENAALNPFIENILGKSSLQPCSFCSKEAKRYVICGKCKIDYCSSKCKKQDKKHKCEFVCRTGPSNLKDLKEMVSNAIKNFEGEEGEMGDAVRDMKEQLGN
jgi:hypothetical protein